MMICKILYQKVDVSVIELGGDKQMHFFYATPFHVVAVHQAAPGCFDDTYSMAGFVKVNAL